MNVLIVSFDKNLVNRLREVLGEHNVVDVKNGEEAINTVSSYMDVVIYDAVSGSISEEDINNMFRQKFKDSKYIVLVDDLFPVDMNNIMPPRKIKVMRDEAVEKIPTALFEEAGEEKPESLISEEEAALLLPESVVSFEEKGATQEAGMEEVFGFRELELSTSRKKLLLVSFDTSLINNIKEALSDRVDIVEAKNVKEAIEKAREADIILFDTISGMLAYRTLSDMAKDDFLARKPYVLLIDELFTIDVGSIPLERKFTFAREAELSKALEKIAELLEEAPAEYPAEAVQETPLLEERLPTDLQPATLQEEDRSIMSLLEEIIGAGFEETGEQEKMSLSPEEEKTPEVAITEEAPVSQSMPYMENVAESRAMAIREVIREELSQEKVYSALSHILSPEEIGRQLSTVLERKLEQILREKVSEVLSGIDVSKIVREEAYRVMKERLSELIT
ncbi:MAG: hypothetical protein ACK42C_02765 [Aquificaceae bacterium]